MTPPGRERVLKLGFIVNPIAGLGGSVGLKGTDGVVDEAIKRGGKPLSPKRAVAFVKALASRIGAERLAIYAAPGVMGEDYVLACGLPCRVVGALTRSRTTREDTIRIARELRNAVDLLVFVGGDGTARDILEAVGNEVLVLGIPAGVKVYSSVFALNPARGAEVVEAVAAGTHGEEYGEVLDIDEEAYRRDELRVKFYGVLRVPFVPEALQSSKEPTALSADEAAAMRGIAEHFREYYFDPNTIYVLGPGTTVKHVAEGLGIPKTLLGVDVTLGSKLLEKDTYGSRIVALVERYRLPLKIVVTPIGGQGYVFGRGNQQIGRAHV